MVANHTEIEKRLWEAADELRANSRLRAADYSVPVLGLSEKSLARPGPAFASRRKTAPPGDAEHRKKKQRFREVG